MFEAKPYTGKTAFEQWVEYEGVPMIRDFIVSDLNAIEVRPWDRLGASGSWVILGAPEDQLSMGAYVCEIGLGQYRSGLDWATRLAGVARLGDEAFHLRSEGVLVNESDNA